MKISNKDRLKQLCNEYLGFDPSNEEDCLKVVKLDGSAIRYIKNPLKKFN